MRMNVRFIPVVTSFRNGDKMRDGYIWRDQKRIPIDRETERIDSIQNANLLIFAVSE